MKTQSESGWPDADSWAGLSEISVSESMSDNMLPLRPQPVIRVKKTRPRAILPRYIHPGDSGFDLFFGADRSVTIFAGKHQRLPTGLVFELPAGHEVQIRSKSGRAAKEGLFVLNSPGTVDEGYRGEICVILANFGSVAVQNEPGDKIAQGVLVPVVRAEIEEVAEIAPSTSRGTGGMGSTGIR